MRPMDSHVGIVECGAHIANSLNQDEGSMWISSCVQQLCIEADDIARYIRKRHDLPRGQRTSRGTQGDRDTSSISKSGASTSDVINRPTLPGQSDREEILEQQFAGIARAQPIQLAQGGQIQQNACPNYFGDSSHSLSYIIEVVYRPKGGSAEPLKVHYPIPAFIADRPSANHEPRIEELMAALRDAFTMPSRDIADQLVRTFFNIIHPAYPVFDRTNFTRLYLQGRASPLVLQTIFLLGFTVGSETLVHDAGYTDRATARRTHYLRAKALYDADYENDPTITTAVLLLLGFWWSGPDDQKDPCYWIGCAVTVAQSLGMHRSYVKLTSILKSMLTLFQHITICNESTSQVFAEANLVVNICNLLASRNLIFKLI